MTSRFWTATLGACDSLRIETHRCRTWYGIASLAAGLIISVSVPANADNVQNVSVGGTTAQLGPFGILTGNGVTVGVVEAGGGLANTSSGVAGSAGPANNLPNGNPDLPSTSVILFEVNGGALPAGGVAAATKPGGGALPAALKLSNHGTEVTGVIVGQGKAVNGAADRGIAPGSFVQEAGIAGGEQDATYGVPALIQSEVTTYNASAINLSFGASQYLKASGAGANQLALLTVTVAGGNVTAYGTQLFTFGGALPVLPAGTSYARYANGNFVFAYGTNAGALVPTNNGSAYNSTFVDWEAIQNPKSLIVVAGNESAAPAPLAVPGVANTGILSTAAIPGIGAAAPANFGTRPSFNTVGAPSDAYNILNVGATGGYVAGNFTYDVLAGYNTPNGTSDRRVGVNLVAPGGDPAGAVGTAGANIAGGLVFGSNFKSTAGGVVSGGSSDTYNGVEAGFVDPTTASNYQSGGGIVQPVGKAGTSFAAPLVAGADALLVQYAKANSGADALDNRVQRALLMNGASKINVDHTPLLVAPDGRSWQAQPPIVGPFSAVPAPFATFQSYKNGVATGVPVGQFPVQSGLDPLLGTGQLNVLQSLVNLAAGEQHSGNVQPTGWDYFTIPAGTQGQPNQKIYPYNFTINATTGFQATLDWDSPVTIAGGGAGNTTWAPNATFTRGSLQDLDLYLFSTNGLGGALTQNLDFSTSLIDNDQHVYLPSLSPGTYQLDVVVQGTTTLATPYGLAWATVPEPSALILASIALLALLMRRRRAAA